MSDLRKKLKHVPNTLSAFRIVLVPVFVFAYFSGVENARLIAAAIYFVAAATDVLDGFIARRFQLITNLGRILDPLGDKLMALALVSCLTIDGRFPYWALIIYAAKEFCMLLGGVVVHKRYHADMPAANYLGKAGTVSLFIVGVAVLLADISPATTNMLVAVPILITLLALVSYIMNFFKNIAKTSADPGGKEEEC